VRRASGFSLALLLTSSPVVAQTIGVAASRWLTDPRVSDYRLSISSYRFGPVAVVPFGQVAVQGPRDGGAFLVGIGGDLMVPLTAAARPYLVGGGSVGAFDFRRSVGLALWSAWSAGAGVELARVLGLGAALEVRYQALSRERTGGVTLGIRVGTPLGRRAGREAGAGRGAVPADRAPIAPIGSEPSTPRRRPQPDEARPRSDSDEARPRLGTVAVSAEATISRAIEVARDAMGAPYRWGGTDANGFDCSGLIWYAYDRVGIALPRRSRDQALAGRSVGAAIDGLAPGDILVFSRTPGGEPSHVGLYLGSGSFIHSASRGTAISRLAPEDPGGRWWFDRWIDSRRIVE